MGARMILTDIMKYVESEYNVINNTPCEICGGSYEAEELEIVIVDGEPFDVCLCFCSKCGHEKVFEFPAPFVLNDNSNYTSNLN
jgi:hypothetical protein